jgi:hypothetical protein
MFTYCLGFKLILVFGRVLMTGVLGICARDCVLYKGPVDVTISPRKRRAWELSVSVYRHALVKNVCQIRCLY